MKTVNGKYSFVLRNSEQERAYEALLLEAKNKKITHSINHFSPANTAKLIYLFKNYSSRSIASLIFIESDVRFGNSLSGRDVKRWAAETLGILEEAVRSWAN